MQGKGSRTAKLIVLWLFIVFVLSCFPSCGTGRHGSTRFNREARRREADVQDLKYLTDWRDSTPPPQVVPISRLEDEPKESPDSEEALADGESLDNEGPLEGDKQ